MMKRNSLHIATWLMAAAGLLAATGCSTFESDDPLTVMERSDMAALRINVYTPSEMSTRAEDTEAAQTAERQIHSIRVYAYLNESECTQQLIDEHQLSVNVDQLKQRCVGYAILSSTDGLTVNDDLEYTWVEMGLPRYTINKKLDFYAMANMEGTGFESVAALGYYPTRTAVENCSFTAFGTTNAVSKQVPETGLPASRILKGLTPVTSLKGNNRLSITLLRAVGKVRFFFAKPQGLTGAQLTAIKLNVNKAGNLTDAQKLPTSAKTMPIADETQDGFKVSLHNNGVALPTGVTRDAGQISYTNFDGLNDDTNGIKAVDDPEVFTKGGKADAPITEDFSQYVARLEANTTEYADGLTYIRESDSKIFGTLSYKLSATDDEKTADFELYTADTDTHAQPCFPRNHYSIVYAYFLGGKLYVKPTVADWIDTDDLEYTIDMSTNMRLFDSWLYRYDTVDQDYTNWTYWAGSHMVVSSGRVESPVAPEVVAGRPLRSPQIQLVTSGSGNFELTVDNEDFEIVRANKNDVGVVTSYDASTNGKLTIAAGHDVYTYFYIVPKEGTTPANPVAKVSLIYNDPVLGPQKVTFNNNVLPGYSDDSSEIWVYYFSEDDYTIDGKLKMYFQDALHPLVPTAVQN